MTDAPTPADRLAFAERDAALARERLNNTAAALQNRLDPRPIARGAMRDIGDRGDAARRASVDAARRNPGALAGIAAGLGLFVIGRPLLRLIRRRRVAPLQSPDIASPEPVQGTES